MTSRVGQQLGNYRLMQLVGAGGFAEVYVGEHVHLGTKAAIKLLHTQLGDANAVEDFRKEARIIAQLVHPNIVRVLEFGVDQTVPFLVMDHAPHGSLSQFYGRGRTVPLDSIVIHTKQIASALQYAHQSKIIHRDIKPANMLIGRNNEILVSDFGIAVISQSSHHQTEQNMAGTVAYMAPEQIQAHARPASDQYALAIMVYEGLCGQRPFGGTFTEIAVKQITTLPQPLHTMISISPEIEQVVFKALAKNPSQRFSQISEFVQALEQAAHAANVTIYANVTTTYLNQPDPPILLQPTQRALPPTQTPQTPPYTKPAASISNTPPTQQMFPSVQSGPHSEPFAQLTLTPLSAPFYQKVNHHTQPPTSYTGLFVPGFLLLGLYVLLMFTSLSPIFSSSSFTAMQVFINSGQKAPAPWSYVIWLNLTMPIEVLLAGPVLGTRRGFFAVAISFTIYAVLELVYFHSAMSLLLLISFLLTPLLMGWLYNSQRSEGFLKSGIRFFLATLLMLIGYRLIRHLIYGMGPLSLLSIILDIFIYGFGASLLTLVATLLERLIRFFMESMVKSQRSKR